MKKLIILYIIFFNLSFGFTKVQCHSKAIQDSIRIGIDLLNSTERDTIFLETYIRRWDNDEHTRYQATKNRNGIFTFNIPVSRQMGYWQAFIYDNKREDSGSETIISRPISIPFLWEAGDSIICKIENTAVKVSVLSQYTFDGKGKNKYILQAELQSPDLIKSYQAQFSKGNGYFDQNFSYVISTNEGTEKKLQILSSQKDELPPTIYDALKSDILYKYGRLFYLTTIKEFKNRYSQKTAQEQEAALLNLEQSLRLNDDTLFQTDGFQISMTGIEYLYYYHKTIADLKFPNKNAINVYNYIKNNAQGKLRETLLTYFIKQATLPEQIDSIIVDSEIYFTSHEGKIEYEKLKQLVEGTKLASNAYTLFDINDESYILNIADFKDKIVFVDFYYTGCTPCTRLYQNVISKVKNHFKNNNRVLFMAISIDRKYDFWLKSVKTNHYTSISPNSINLFAGALGIKHPLFIENNINRFPMVSLFKDGKILYNNTENLFSKDTLIQTIEGLL